MPPPLKLNVRKLVKSFFPYHPLGGLQGAAREAFTACLRTFVESSIQSGKTAETFQAEYPQQCATQERAFRDAVIRRDTANRSTRASAEESANLEVEDARVNFSERYEMSMAPQ